jgi:predicted acetyltransferase
VLDVPVGLFCFELLYADGQDLTQLPYPQRRAALAAAITVTDRLRLTTATEAGDPAALDAVFEQAITDGCEGLVCKSVGPEAIYQAGARAWLQAHDEWGPGVHEDGFGLQPSDEVDSPAGFAAWVARLAEESDPAKPLGAGRVHCTYRWIVEGDRVLGAIALRHELSDFGHIGYGIRPSARRRGLATWALGRMLGEARLLGLDQVLIICEAGNIASAKTIEHHGGILEDIRDTELSAVRLYWIKI